MIAHFNPFNIRFSSSNNWRGQIGSKRGFCEFSHLDYGLRAGFKLLINYIYYKKLDTVSKVINRFAPCNENNTDKYISIVLSRMALAPDGANCISNFQKLEYDLTFYSLCAAILHVENLYILTYADYVRIIKKFNLQKPLKHAAKC